MNRIYLKGIVSALAMAASAAFAQNQEPFTPATPGAPAVGAATTARPTPDASSSVMLKVDGSRVIDAAGQPLGRIENVVLSQVGCAEAAILTAANGRLIPIPWQLVRVSGDTRVAGAMPGANLVFTINTDQARLAAAPSFTRSQWPDMSNGTWLQPSTAFFGSAAAVGATGGSANVITGAGGRTTITGGNTNQIRVPTPANTTGPDGGTTLPPTGRPNQTLPDFQPSTPPPAQTVPPAPTVPPPQTPNNRPPSGVQPTPPPGAAGSAPPPAPRPATQP